VILAPQGLVMLVARTPVLLRSLLRRRTKLAERKT
jgi:hypothetical protein